MEHIFKMLSDFSRIRIINLLRVRKYCVTEMSNILDLSISSISRHMAKMKLVGMVTDEKDAQWVYYMLRLDFAQEHQLLIDYIQQVAEKSPVLMNDQVRAKRYANTGLSCKDLCQCQDSIEQILQGEQDA